MALPKSLPRLIRRKTPALQQAQTTPSIFAALPYELKMMIAREYVLLNVPIIVGRMVARWHLDPEEEAQARNAGAMLRVSRDFRKQLYRLFYENNIFELGWYWDLTNFFEHPGKDHVCHVLVDALRVLVQPSGVPSTILNKLCLLPSLSCVSLRLRGSLLFNSILYETGLQRFLIKLCHKLSGVETVELVIEPSIDPAGAGQMLQDYRDFLSECLDESFIWPTGRPEWRKEVKFNVCLLRSAQTFY